MSDPFKILICNLELQIAFTQVVKNVLARFVAEAIYFGLTRPLLNAVQYQNHVTPADEPIPESRVLKLRHHCQSVQDLERQRVQVVAPQRLSQLSKQGHCQALLVRVQDQGCLLGRVAFPEDGPQTSTRVLVVLLPLALGHDFVDELCLFAEDGLQQGHLLRALTVSVALGLETVELDPYFGALSSLG